MGRNLEPVTNQEEGAFLASSQMKVGDKFEGTIKDIQRSTNPTHKSAYFLSLLQDDGETLRVFTSGTLSSALAEGKLNVGEYIQVIAEGKKKAKSSGFNYTAFTILIDPATKVQVVPAV